MQKAFFTFLLLFAIGSTIAQINITKEQWQADLRFLQQTVHKDYSFLFKKITAEQFDKEVNLLFEQIPSLEEHQIIVGLAKIVALFGYGHTAIWLRGGANQSYGFHKMPYHLYQFSDGVYIQGVHKKYSKAIGAKVLKIEDMPIEEALKAIKPALPVENDQFFKGYGYSYLQIPEVLHAQGIMSELKSTVTLSLEKNGAVFSQTFEQVDAESNVSYGFVQNNEDWLDIRNQDQTPLWLKNLDQIYYYEYLPKYKAVYVRHSQIQDDPKINIPDFYNEVFDFVEQNDVEKLILDVRLNGGGNNYKNKPIVTGVIRNEKINQSGKFFVILGRRTFSACQNLVNELDNYTNVVFVGEPTGENINFYGDNRNVALPNSKISARLSFAWWQDKPQWENRDWLLPHVPTELSFEDYVNNNDPAVEAIWAYDYDSPIVDPMQHLTDLFTAGKLNEIKPEATRLLKDPRYQYYPFEDQFNKAGHSLLNNGQTMPALFVLQMNNEFFPESAKTWDSLAEAHWKAGQIEKAVSLYKKAIELDPNGPTGENSKKMLEQIKQDKK